ncbi:hypothetical protein LCI18_013373 [Fusarium solani-melongenae]|uniref:Uncharacterized protein n=1 Tax=Fusarium solani subsp. cucurbitae TaxID=2747967 RepID=A0ACD3ZQS3_FUSSC|nr:hypothetical protein LCI18_013373 [Fusarium solani-melongenae]
MEGLTKHLGRGHEVEVIDLDKSGNIARRWVHMPNNRIIRKAKPSLFKRSMRKIIMDAFLPIGYPHSVSGDYLAYQFFDSLQAFFSTITSLLANRALLQGLGVGDANSSATFAMLLTVLKDAMSRVATIIFAQQFGLRIEPDAKRYRFLADLFNDTAFFLELYSPYFGPYGKILALTSGEALRALCGVAGGASKAALSVHFAKHDNLAELNAKEASQETAVGLIGLLVGTFVVKHVEDHTSVVYLMTVLVLAHLWMNYLGVRSVCMNVLNRQRATILFEEYLKSGNVLTPGEVAHRESILFWSPVVRNRHGQRIARIEMADSFGNAMGGQEARVNIAILDGLMSTLFIWSHASHKYMPIKIMLWKDSEAVHAISAWFMAMEIAWQMDKGKGYTERLDRIFCGKSSRPSNWNTELKKDGDQVDEDYQQKYDDHELWEEMLAKGWNLASQAFETEAPVRMAILHEDKKDQ